MTSTPGDKHPIYVNLVKQLALKKKLSEENFALSKESHRLCRERDKWIKLVKENLAKSIAKGDEYHEQYLVVERLEETWKQCEIKNFTREQVVPKLDQYLKEMMRASAATRPELQKKWDKMGLPLSLVSELLEDLAAENGD